MPAPIHTNTREHTRHEQHLKLLCCNASRPCLAVWLPESNSQWLQPLLKASACFLWCGCNVGRQLCSRNVKAISEVSRRMVHGLVSRISRSLPGIYSNIVVGWLAPSDLTIRPWLEGRQQQVVAAASSRSLKETKRQSMAEHAEAAE